MNLFQLLKNKNNMFLVGKRPSFYMSHYTVDFTRSLVLLLLRLSSYVGVVEFN